MTTRNLIARYQEWFPPMYREEEGFGYSWSVFRQRVFRLGKLIGVLAILLAITLAVVPASDEFGLKELWVVLFRLLAVGSIGFMLLKAIASWRIKRLEYLLTPITLDKDARAVAKLVGGPYVVAKGAGCMILREVQPTELSDEELAIQHLVINLTTDKARLPWEEGRAKKAIAGACEFHRLVQFSKYRLVLRKERSVVPKDALFHVAIVFFEGTVGGSGPSPLEGVDLSPMTDLLFGRRTRTVSRDEAIRMFDFIGTWLESIDVSVEPAGSEADPWIKPDPWSKN